jgi:hypothetical protein
VECGRVRESAGECGRVGREWESVGQSVEVDIMRRDETECERKGVLDNVLKGMRGDVDEFIVLVKQQARKRVIAIAHIPRNLLFHISIFSFSFLLFFFFLFSVFFFFFD